jgi:hypothetical protein
LAFERAESLRKTEKKQASGYSNHACQRRFATYPNHIGSWDFLFDRIESGHTLEWFTIVDEYTRRCMTLDVSTKFKSKDIIDRLAELFVMYAVLRCIRSENGPEFIAEAIQGG